MYITEYTSYAQETECSMVCFWDGYEAEKLKIHVVYLFYCQRKRTLR